MNSMSAKEWLTKSWHNLSTAALLYGVNHYTDIIVIDGQINVMLNVKFLILNENQSA